MKDRIKYLRTEHLKMTQQEFADQLGIKRGAIANYEIGRNEPVDSVISLICYKYNVNEDWLRTGEGDMLVHQTREEEMAAYFGRLMGGNCSDIERAIISLMSKATPEDWELVTTFARELAAAMEAKEKPDH